MGEDLCPTPSDRDPNYGDFAILNMQSVESLSRYAYHFNPTEKEQGRVFEGRFMGHDGLWLLTLLTTSY